MGRPVTLFTGQWADLPLEELAARARAWGFDGLELATWGDHFEVDRALADPAYVKGRRELLKRYGLECWAISTHLVGQCVCDPIDSRHRAIVPPEVWGDGEPEGVRRRAAQRLADVAKVAAAFGVQLVTGFTGSSVWSKLYSFPPNDFGTTRKTLAAIDRRPEFGLNFDPSHMVPQFLDPAAFIEEFGDRVYHVHV